MQLVKVFDAVLTRHSENKNVMKLKMYESKVKAAVPKITKITKDSQSYVTFIFSDWRILIRLSKTFERFLKIWKSYLVLWDTSKRKLQRENKLISYEMKKRSQCWLTICISLELVQPFSSY